MSSATITKEIILTDNGPAPLATYSQATRAGNTLYWLEKEGRTDRERE